MTLLALYVGFWGDREWPVMQFRSFLLRFRKQARCLWRANEMRYLKVFISLVT
ncbi:hypothetical protein FHS27_004811 [Rhodopirellula rubra]|uniref:Uncharacterized protein n=1 Tax=Aporhodopirellula rubra TaxID=980271 RepID=A0A7W5E361_9BACT|nr:hypothetical protein [Aporhodopirellula rubra]MBB3208977.1 hypothetical protein [Aporhodopirellula rubra]